MKRLSNITILTVFGAVLLALILVPIAFGQGVTNFSGLQVDGNSTTATPAFVADQAGAGVIAEFRDAATPVARFPNGGGLTVVSGGLTVTAGGGTITAGGLTITAGGLTLSDGDAVVADDLRVTAQTSITVTNGAAFTPTGTYQPITAAGEVTPTITAGATAGDLLVLINTSAQVVNIADSGTAKLTAAAALNQFDTLTLWSDGTNWIEISRTDN